jgi:hypothetical protein
MSTPSHEVHTSTSEQAGSNATIAIKVYSSTESDDAHSELVQNFRDLFRDASPFSLRGSIQERKEEIERAIAIQNALQQTSELGSSGGGLRLALDEDKRLDRRIEGNRAVVAAMRELHGKVRAKMWRRRKEAREKRKRAKAMERREKLAAQALGECEGSA